MANIPTVTLEPFLVDFTDPTTGAKISGSKSKVKKQVRANRKAARKTARKARKDGLVDRTEGTVIRSPIELLGAAKAAVKKPRRPGPSTKRTGPR